MITYCYDGDTMAVYPLYTKEAIREAKEKMHPRFTKSMWVTPSNYSGTPYSITLDGAVAIYTATKH